MSHSPKENLKTMPISGRIAEEDFVFLMENSTGGMVTASEKLRHVCAFYRRYHQNLQNYSDCEEELRLWLQPAHKRLKTAEREEQIHSEILEILYTVLPQLMSVLTADEKNTTKSRRAAMQAQEDEALRRTLDLLESLLRLGTTRQAPAYNPNILQNRFKNIIELIEIIRSRT